MPGRFYFGLNPEIKSATYYELFNDDADAPTALIRRTPNWLAYSTNIKTVSNHVTTEHGHRDDVLSAPWLSFDNSQWWNVLALDIDNNDWLDPWLRLPRCCRPHVVADPWSGRAAGLYVLRAPVLATDPRQVRYARHVQRLAAHIFNATPLPHQTLTKNPWGTLDWLDAPLKRRTVEPSSGLLWDAYTASRSPLCWSTLTGTPAVSLHDLFDTDAFRRAEDDLAGNSPIFRPHERPEPSDLGRNCNLFDRLRFHAYDSRESDFEALMGEAERMNTGGLPQSELRAIARSVAKFMTDRYRPGEQKKRGVMGLDNAAIPLPVKQRLSASRTNAVRTADTDHKLRQAMQHWPVGKKLTQSGLAKASGVSERTIRARWKDLNLPL